MLYGRTVRRLLPLLVLYAVLAQATGVAWAATEDRCAAQCGDDDDRGGQCPPNCPDCVCSIHVAATFAAPLVVTAVAPPATRVRFAEPAAATPSPDPSDILHVPRALLV